MARVDWQRGQSGPVERRSVCGRYRLLRRGVRSDPGPYWVPALVTPTDGEQLPVFVAMGAAADVSRCPPRPMWLSDAQREVQRYHDKHGRD